MKKVRYIGYGYSGLTKGRVYDVIYYYSSKAGNFWDDVTVINDYGQENVYNIYDHKRNLLFKDGTQEYRNDIINEILE